MTPAGIEPATLRFVAQHLNHCATLRIKEQETRLTLHEHDVMKMMMMNGDLPPLSCTVPNKENGSVNRYCGLHADSTTEVPRTPHFSGWIRILSCT